MKTLTKIFSITSLLISLSISNAFGANTSTCLCNQHLVLMKAKVTDAKGNISTTDLYVPQKNISKLHKAKSIEMMAFSNKVITSSMSTSIPNT